MRADPRTYYANKKPGPCERCGQTVAAHEGRVRRDRHFNWYVSHWLAREVGWPNVRWEGGCPPRPADASPTLTEEVRETPAAMTPEQARTILHQRMFGPDQATPRYREPGTEQGRERLEADMIRLATMPWDALIKDPEGMATLLEISDHQRWDG